MFIIDLVPLVLGDLCLCRKTIHKYQISSTRSNWSKVGPPWATWWGQPTPHGIVRRGNTCATSPIHGSGKETHPQAFSATDPKSVQDQGLKMCITWIVEATMLMSLLKWTKGLHTHTLLHP